MTNNNFIAKHWIYNQQRAQEKMTENLNVARKHIEKARRQTHTHTSPEIYIIKTRAVGGSLTHRLIVFVVVVLSQEKRKKKYKTNQKFQSVTK